MPIDLNGIRRKLRNLSARQNIIYKSELFRDILKNSLGNIDSTSAYYTEVLVDIRSIEYIIDNFSEQYCHITEKNVMHINNIYKKHKIKINEK